MTWAQDQRICFIKERIDAGQTVTRADLREKFYITVQTATATFHEFRRRYPDLMRYCSRTKAMVPASWVPDSEVDWKARALAAEAQLADRPSGEAVELLREARDLLMERRHGNAARSPAHNARLVVEQAIAALSPVAVQDGQ